MSLNASKDLIDLIDSRITAKKYQRVAVIESVSEDNKTAVVRFPETDTTFEFYNKTGEVLTPKESVYIASNDGDLMNGYIQNRFGESTWLVAGKNIDIEDGSVDGDKLADGAVDSDHLADGAIIGTKIADFTVDNAKIGFAAIDTANIRDATITNAKIQDAAITNAKIENLAVDNAKIGIAAIDTANIKNLAVKRAAIDLEAVGTSQIADGSITDAKIVSLTAEKIVTGTIDTSKVTVLGTSGKLRIANNRLQVFDNQTVSKERVSLGDVNGDGTIYGFRIRGADGSTTLIDETGVKAEGITDGSITNAKISGTAEIQGTKLLDESTPGGKLVVDSVTARQIAAKTITANEIVANTITASEIAAGAITADEIAAEAITAAKIKAGEITTSHVNSTFGQSLNLGSNTTITLTADQIIASGAMTFEQTKALANAARSNAVADMTDNLYLGKTTINGGCISTNTIDCSKISGGTLNFGNIYASGTMQISDLDGAGLKCISGTHIGGIGSNSTRGLTLTTNDSMYFSSSVGGGTLTITMDTTAPNIPNTASSGSEKIKEIKYVGATGSEYFQFAVDKEEPNTFGIYPGISDRRFKQNILNSDLSALNRLNSIKIRKFDWIENNKHEDFGMIAQELEQDIGENYIFKVQQSDNTFSYQVNDFKFTPLIVKSIQELNAELKEAKNEISLLKTKTDIQDQIIHEMRLEIENIKKGMVA